MADVVVVPDEVEPRSRPRLRAAVADGVDLVATTGGTGFAPRDVTPEATRRLLDREAPGSPRRCGMFNRDEVPTTILSRAVAGTVGSTDRRQPARLDRRRP